MTNESDNPEIPVNTIHKDRLDKLLVDLGLCESRNKAQALIMAGKVRIKEQKVDKAGTIVKCTASEIRVIEDLPYVSRGGLKLEKALKEFNINPEGFTCIDVGSSTGGFTDCMLQNGARHVYAVDVGTNQLAWQLRSDERVTVLENTNAKELTPKLIPDKAELITIDVSFISLKKVLPPLKVLLTKSGCVVALIKPQFEYKDYIEDNAKFDGVVRNPKHHERITSGLIEDLSNDGWTTVQLTESPITGPKGNIEFLAKLTTSS